MTEREKLDFFTKITNINFGSPRMRVTTTVARTLNSSSVACFPNSSFIGAGLKLIDRTQKCVKVNLGGGEFMATWTEKQLFTLPNKSAILGIINTLPPTGEVETHVTFETFHNGPKRLSGAFPPPDDIVDANHTNIPGTDQVTVSPLTLPGGLKIWVLAYEFIPE